jgi:Lysophospholipase
MQTQAVGETQEHLKMSDGFELFYRQWHGPNPADRAVLFFHGIEVHSGAFRFMGPELAADGTEVYGFDRRGFGNSKEPDLPRGDTHGFNRHLEDINELVDYIHQNNENKPLFLFGHSIGCAYALWFAAHYPDKVSGLILSSPPLETGFKLPASDTLKIAGAGHIQHHNMFDLIDRWPQAFLESEEYQLISSDELCTKSFGLGYLLNVQTKLANKMPDNASKITKPTQLLHGEKDIVALPSSSNRILGKLASSDKNLHLFPEADHWLYQSIIPQMSSKYSLEQKQTVSGVVKDWLNRR